MLFFGLTPFATQPIRAAYFPAINEGEPTACRTKLEFSCTFSKGTADAFSYNFNRGQYGKPDLSDRQATFGEQWLSKMWDDSTGTLHLQVGLGSGPPAFCTSCRPPIAPAWSI